MCDFRTNVQKQWLQTLESFIAATNHHRELALLQSDHAARNRRVHHVGALLANFRSQRTAHFRAHRAHVKVELARTNAGEQSIRPVSYRGERGGVRHHGERHIRRSGHGFRRLGKLHALVDQPLRLRARPDVAGHGVSLFEQTSYHVAAHHTETDESKFRHTAIPFPYESALINSACRANKTANYFLPNPSAHDDES